MFIDPTQYPKLAGNPYVALMRNCNRARYAELVSPEEAVQAAAEAGIATPPPGWKVYAELESSDIERLSEGRRRVRLTVEEFDEGLPLVVIAIEAAGTSYVWAVPMWEAGAQDWLREAVSQKRIGLILNATDSSMTTTLVTGTSLIEREDELLRVAEVSRMPKGVDAHVFHMLDAGLRLMNGALEARSSAPEAVKDLRVMVTGRGANAVHLMNTFVASEQMAQMLLPQADQAIQ
ncbi:hypothetical protein [Paracidovorax citrulli]|uniref:hypothetical protein n=1 Tax=Paracidovorax citrulli TaxID=80869 RepID=UPI000ADF3B03|nr:hypothetical protein [Paracidovorax citrulli]